MTRFGARLTDEEGGRSVAVKPADLGGDVDVDDVAILQNLVSPRDTVTHDIVSAGAHRSGKPMVPELAGGPPAELGVFANPALDIRGAYSRG